MKMEWVKVSKDTCIATYKFVTMEEVKREIDRIKKNNNGYNCPRLVKNKVWSLHVNCKGYTESFCYIFDKITDDEVIEIKNHLR